MPRLTTIKITLLLLVGLGLAGLAAVQQRREDAAGAGADLASEHWAWASVALLLVLGAVWTLWHVIHYLLVKLGIIRS